MIIGEMIAAKAESDYGGPGAYMHILRHGSIAIFECSLLEFTGCASSITVR